LFLTTERNCYIAFETINNSYIDVSKQSKESESRDTSSVKYDMLMSSKKYYLLSAFHAFFAFVQDLKTKIQLEQIQHQHDGLIYINQKRRDKAQSMRDTSYNEEKLIHELNTLNKTEINIENTVTRKILVENFNILSTDPETRGIFPEPPLISYRRDKKGLTSGSAESSNAAAATPVESGGKCN